MKDNKVKFGDLFAGGGGTSTGAYSVPGVHVSWALNHDETAIKTHEANHPETIHYQADITVQDENELEPVDILWASLECTEHSKAKGGQDKNLGSFMLEWELPRYIVATDPHTIIIENVPDFLRWGKLKKGKRVRRDEGLEYLRWVKHIQSLGWVNYSYKLLNAADYGAPTRRIRYFGIFSKAGQEITWPEQTHIEDPDNLFGLKKHVACKDFIDLDNTGQSIFGRKVNPQVKRKVDLSPNTMKRIAGGIKKFAPEMVMIMKYYGKGNNCQSIEDPLHTVRTKESLALVTMEKLHFVSDHMWGGKTQTTEDPLQSITTQEAKELITVERQFLSKYYNPNRSSGKIQDHASDIEKPFPTITTTSQTPLITAKAQFISSQNNSNGNPSANNKGIDKPLNSITTMQKFQFISAYFNSSGNPGSQNQSTEKPLNTILTAPNKKALVTAYDGIVDFDIKMRFLTWKELAKIMGFPDGYFEKDGLKLTKKQIHKMIGNAVHSKMAKALVQHNCNLLLEAS